MTTDAPTPSQEFTVYDRTREVQFSGIELAFASSDSEGKDRWLELRLFRTDAGMYIIAAKGKSRIPGERTRCHVHQCERPEAVLDQAYSRDDEGTWYLTNVYRKLLEDAGKVDPDIDRAYRVERVA